VLQEGSFERVGGTQTLHSDARITAATNRDLKSMIREERFREDLYYRLNVVHIDLPPLRSRMQDLPVLTEHLLKKINARQHTAVRHIAEGAWRRLKDYAWPGNIRELENVLTRAAVLARGDTLTPELLALPADAAAKAAPEAPSAPRLISLDELELEHISAILTQVRWHCPRNPTRNMNGFPALARHDRQYRCCISIGTGSTFQISRQ
jgi:DNA-binding NtrC family response regulator